MGQTLFVSKTPRKTVVAARKRALAASGHNYSDLAREADVTYSMADKWMNDRRTSGECQRAFDVLVARASRSA